jgi:protease-4
MGKSFSVLFFLLPPNTSHLSPITYHLFPITYYLFPITHSPITMKEFLKYTLASLVGNLLSSFLVITLGVGGLIGLIVVTSSKTPEIQVKDKSVLLLDLSLNIRDTQATPTPNDIVTDAFSEDEPEKMPLKRVLDTLERAKNDPKIVAIYLKGSSDIMSTGLANQQELRLALQRFKESKKPIFAYDTNWSKSEYYLASVANTIAVNPMGNMEFNGLNSEMMFLGGAFEKFGIGAQVTRVGKYKSAVELFCCKK